MRTTRKIGFGAAAVLAVTSLALAPSTADAQRADWAMPWLGCWVEVGAPADAPMTCLVPEEGGVAFLTVDRGGVADRRLIRPGGPHDVAAGGCEGTQTVRLARDGARLFVGADMVCEGGAERTAQELFAMATPERWLHVRGLSVAGLPMVLTTVYRPADTRLRHSELPELAPLRQLMERADLALESARVAAAVPPTVDGVIDAVDQTHPELVKAWLAEVGEPMDLDADALLRLARADVDESVIDLLIAVSYPDRFTVDYQLAQAEGRLDPGVRSYHVRPYGWWPYWYDPFGYYGWGPYSRYGYGYGYGYGWGYGYYGYGPTVVVVRPSNGDGTYSRGRAIRGRGYSGPRGSGASAAPRARPSTGRAAPARSSGDGGTRARPSTTRSRPTATTGSRPTATPRSRPSSSSGSRGIRSSSSGSSSGSSSSGSKGSAKPKGGGGI